jgi:hypothetical protein
MVGKPYYGKRYFGRFKPTWDIMNVSLREVGHSLKR